MITPSDTQSAAIAEIIAWAKGGSATAQEFYLAGFAGVGKSTVANVAIQELIDKRICRRIVTCAYTGKAASVLRKKGVKDAMTGHAAIYRINDPDDDDDKPKPKRVLRDLKFSRAIDGPASRADLIVIDEGSMIPDDMADDFRSFGKKILIMGDPGQLPPVRGSGAFTNRRPDVFLTEIHRQAADSPILRIATAARLRERIDLGHFDNGCSVQRLSKDTQPLIYRDDTMPICGVHRVRWVYSQRIRKSRGFEGPGPAAAEAVMCCKNARDLGIFNGGMGTIIDEPWDLGDGLLRMNVDMEDGPILSEIAVDPYLFGEHFSGKAIPPKMRRDVQWFDWAYVTTAHKAQGSEWPDVTVIDDSGVFREDSARWLYTAVTRASERLTLLLRD